MQYLGVPYVWGGASPSGFDCSGFAMYVYAQVGVSLPHNAAMQYSSVGVYVPRDQLQPGDLVFFDGLGHMGMYIGGGQFIHAPHTGDVVKISSLDDSWYASTYVGAESPLNAGEPWPHEPPPSAQRAVDPPRWIPAIGGAGLRLRCVAHGRRSQGWPARHTRDLRGPDPPLRTPSRRASDAADEYSPSTSSAKCSSTTRRLSLSVGVTSPCSISKSRGRIANRLICSKRERSRLTSSTMPDTSVDDLRVARERRDVAVEPLLRGPLADLDGVEGDQRRRVGAPVADDERLRHEPGRLEVVLEVLRRDVLAAGGDDDVLLPVGDRDEAVLVDRRDVARAQPSVRLEHLGRRLGILVVARRRSSRCGSSARRPRRGGARTRAAPGRPFRSGMRSLVFVVAAVVHSVRPYPSRIRMPIASKNSATSFASGAPPEIGIRSRPPRRSFTFEKTSRSAIATCIASPRGTRLALLPQLARPRGRRRAPSRSAVDGRPVASAKVDGRRCAPSRRRAGRSGGSSAAPAASHARPRADRAGRRSCSRRTAPERWTSRPKLCASGR